MTPKARTRMTSPTTYCVRRTVLALPSAPRGDQGINDRGASNAVRALQFVTPAFAATESAARKTVRLEKPGHSQKIKGVESENAHDRLQLVSRRRQ